MRIDRHQSRPVPASAGLVRLIQWTLFGVLLMAAEGAWAVSTCVSNTTGGGLWNAASTWTNCGGGIPGNNDSVTIKSGDTVILNVDTPTLRDIVVESGGVLRGDGTGKVLTAGRTGGENISNAGLIDFTGGNAAVMRLGQASQWGGTGTYALSVLDLNSKALNFTAATNLVLDLSGAFPILNPGSIGCLATSTWNFNGTVAQTLPASTGICYGNLVINNAAGVTMGVALSGTNIVGDLTVQSGVFNNGGFAITLAAGRNFSVQGDSTFNLTGTSAMATVSGGGTKSFNTTAPCSTVNYGGANQTVSNEAYGNLTLGGSGTKTLPGSAMTVACDFKMEGTAGATAAQNLIVGGNFEINGAGATFSAATFSHVVQGNFSRTGTFNANTSTFTFNGSAAQSITGATTFRNLTLDNAAGLTLVNNVTASNLLTFTSGRITTGANRMIIGTTASHTGSSATSYVFGTMEKVGPVGTFTYAIGDSTNYAPVTTAFTAGGATGSLAANTTAGDHPDIANSGLNPALNVNRYWTLTSTGLTGTYDATFNFVSGDKDGGSDDTVYEIMRYAGGWNVTTVGTRTGTSTQATGLTAFGDFAVGEILPPLDHYLIAHDGGMVSCDSEDITFTAHNDTHGALFPDLGTVLSIATTTGRGRWTTLVAGTGTLSDPTPGNPDNGDASYIFPGDEASVTLRLRYTNPVADPEPVNFNVTDNNGKTEATGTGTALADNNDQDLVVASAGFNFYNSTDANTLIPVQIAGKRSDEGYGAKNLALRAVRVSDSDPTVCTAAFPNGGSVDVEVGAECINPSTCAGNVLTVTNNGTPTDIATNNDNGTALTSSYTSVSLTFSANSTAELHFRYPDAGQMQLHARHDLGDPVGSYMAGSSGNFVVRPFGFKVTATGNPPAMDENGDVYVAADEVFTVEVSAVGWEAADDANNDGVPDGHEAGDNDPATPVAPGISDNAVLPNFGQEAGAGEDVALSAVLLLPAGGADPGLAGGTTITSFSAGAGSTATARYAEVGIIEIDATIGDGDYLGIGVAETALVHGKSGHVGRFTPFEFAVSGNTPTFAPACNADTTDFTYMQQPFQYDVAAVATLTAKSKLGATTTNYANTWSKVITLTDAYAHDGTPLPGGVTLDAAAAGFTAPSCTGAGICTITFNGPFTYARSVTPVAPVDGVVDITLDNIADSDGVAYNGAPFKFEDVVFAAGMSQQRWGRLVVGQGVGDPAIALEVPITAEYFDGTGFALNADDDCTAFTLADDVTLSNETSGSQDGDQPMAIDAGTTSVTSGDGLLVDGLDVMTFSAPGAGNTGLVDISLDLDTVSGADLPWLQSDWDGEGLFETTAEGRATFGIYSRPDGLIYSREPW